jgi:hypothetical protein
VEHQRIRSRIRRDRKRRPQADVGPGEHFVVSDGHVFRRRPAGIGGVRQDIRHRQVVIFVRRRWPDLAYALNFSRRAQVDHGGNGQVREHPMIVVGQGGEIVGTENSPPTDMPAMIAGVSAQIPEVEGPVEGDQPVRLSVSTIHDRRISKLGA